MFKKIVQLGLDFLFPKTCLLCNKEGKLLCLNCFKTLKPKDPSCPKCSKKNELGQFCSDCKKDFALNGVLVAGDLSNINLEKIIKLYKYHFIKDLGETLAGFMYNFLKNNILANPILKHESSKYLDLNDYLIIPIPLSNKRLKWRGFNQSEILAQHLAKKLQLPISLELKRIKHRTAQAKLDQRERQSNLQDCFLWTGKSLAQKNILLIDDICTTGSTLNEAAKELKKHQAGAIWGLVLAK